MLTREAALKWDAYPPNLYKVTYIFKDCFQKFVDIIFAKNIPFTGSFAIAANEKNEQKYHEERF